MKRNGIISFWKFLYSILIIIFHARLFASTGDKALALGGYIGVEFFFIVSGVFLASSIIKTWDKDNTNLGKETLMFIWKKFCFFFPYLLIAYITILGLFIFAYDFPIYKLANNIWELFLLQKTGINYFAGNVSTWYLSSMLLSMFIIYPLMRKFKMNYVYFIAPIVVVFGIGTLSHVSESLNSGGTWIGFTDFANVRAFVELNLGILLYFISNKLKNINFTKLGLFCLTVIEIVCLSLPFFTSTLIKNSYRYDYLMLVIIAIGVCIATSNITLEKNILNKNIVYYFEKLSLPLYILHAGVLKIIYRIDYLYNIPLSYASLLAMSLGISLVFAIIALKVIEGLRSKNFYLDKIKRLFIVE